MECYSDEINYGQLSSETKDQFRVEVASPGKFRITSSSNSESCERTLADFHFLHNQLQSENPSIILPAVPERASAKLGHVMQSPENALLLQLRVYLNKLSTNPRITMQEEYKLFLQNSPFQHVKETLKEKTQTIVKKIAWGLDIFKKKEDVSELESENVVNSEKSFETQLENVQKIEALTEKIYSACEKQAKNFETGAESMKTSSTTIQEFFSNSENNQNLEVPFKTVAQKFEASLSKMNRHLFSLESVVADLKEIIKIMKIFKERRTKVIKPIILKVKQSGLSNEYVEEEVNNYVDNLKDLEVQAKSIQKTMFGDSILIQKMFEIEMKDCLENSSKIWGVVNSNNST